MVILVQLGPLFVLCMADALGRCGLLGWTSLLQWSPLTSGFHSEHRRLATHHGCHSEDALHFLNYCNLFSDWMRSRAFCHHLTSPPLPIREYFAFIHGIQGNLWMVPMLSVWPAVFSRPGTQREIRKKVETTGVAVSASVICSFQEHRPGVLRMVVQAGPM